MIDRNKVITALENKRPKFRGYRQILQDRQVRVDDWLNQFCRYDVLTIEEMLAESGVAWPGAWPTPELDQAQRLCLPFAQRWSDHRAARAWAMSVLLNRPVIAVDGSQITPTKDIWPPVGAVQIGWFINHHREGGSYVKDLAFEVLAPDELLDDPEGNVEDESEFLNVFVNRERFVRECEKLRELMAAYANGPEEAKPLCFFDGSFIISFAGPMAPSHARFYLSAMQGLLEDAQKYRMPLVAFVDSSQSGDLVTLLETLRREPDGLRMSDARLLEPCLPQWGDRSPFFECARVDKLSQSGRAPFYRDVVFAYIRLTADRPPARLEMPRWLLEAGRAEDLVDLVRAECIIGAGYPYAIETADALAVISQPDRQRFYALFQQFVEKEGLPMVQTRKALSKQGRR